MALETNSILRPNLGTSADVPPRLSMTTTDGPSQQRNIDLYVDLGFQNIIFHFKTPPSTDIKTPHNGNNRNDN